MGKPFTSELQQIPSTIEWIAGVEVLPLRAFILASHRRNVIAVGAGGSYTAAELIRICLDAKGIEAQALTPLAFIDKSASIRDSNVMIFTAGGNNADVIQAAHHARMGEANRVIIVCGSTNSKIEHTIAKWSNFSFAGYSSPVGRDGYLATNSLAIFCGLVLRAFDYDLPSAMDARESLRKGYDVALSEEIRFFLATYAEWAKPAAVDLESKFSEAGIGAVLVADYRNFAHGRHNWIDKNRHSTAFIALITPRSSTLAQRTLSHLPSFLPVVELETKHEGPLGSFDLLLQVFGLTQLVGEVRGIDPGRPGVPTYGSRLYRMATRTRQAKANASRTHFDAAIDRKMDQRGLDTKLDYRSVATKHLREFLEAIKQTRFGALVMDFDGTVISSSVDRVISTQIVSQLEVFLRAGIPLYFATGRGNSINAILAASFHESIWDLINISYYNGALTQTLAEAILLDEDQFQSLLVRSEGFDDIFRALSADEQLISSAKLDHKICQLVVKPADKTCLGIGQIVEEIIYKNFPTLAKVVRSSHSIDIVPLARSKRTTIELARSQTGLEVLTIGDRGAYPGNDFELLGHPYSLSVDRVSCDLDSCWNILPIGRRNVDGLEFYLSLCRIKQKSFKIAPSTLIK